MILGIQSDRAETFECIYYLSLGPIPWAQLLQLGWAPPRTPWAQLLRPRPFLNPHGLNYISYYLRGIFFCHLVSRYFTKKGGCPCPCLVHVLFSLVWLWRVCCQFCSLVWPCSNLHLNTKYNNDVLIWSYNTTHHTHHPRDSPPHHHHETGYHSWFMTSMKQHTVAIWFEVSQALFSSFATEPA